VEAVEEQQSRSKAASQAWVSVQCLKHGFLIPLQVDLDFNEDEDIRVLLLVHDMRPPFLQGKAVLTKASNIVLPLKDPTSDMAVIAR
jgi:pre-mRNA-splicing factor ATP-dependent RNA helicase DHX38/PRP16